MLLLLQTMLVVGWCEGLCMVLLLLLQEIFLHSVLSCAEVPMMAGEHLSLQTQDPANRTVNDRQNSIMTEAMTQ